MNYSKLIIMSIFALISIIAVRAAKAQAPAQGSGVAAGSNTVQCSAATIDRLLNEVAKLRQELRQLKVEQHQLRIASLERELEQAKANRLRMDAQQDLVRQDVQELDDQLNQPLDAHSYARLLSVKATMLGAPTSSITTEQQSARQREEETTKLLQTERQRLQALVQ